MDYQLTRITQYYDPDLYHASPIANYHQVYQDEQQARDSSRDSLQPQTRPLGRPSAARLLTISDVAAVTVAFIASTLAIVTVAVDSVAWKLDQIQQLTILGFLLSAMNLCMTAVLPTFFLRMEALFGSSTIQNYDAILRSRVVASKASWLWRVVLGLNLALPIGLSALYKSFADGAATITFSSGDSRYNNTFGMFAPPGLLPLGYDSGSMLMYNATMPFLMASTNQSAPRDAVTAELLDLKNEVKLPTFPQPYGFNTVLLSEDSAAILDAMSPEFIMKSQSLLQLNEHWDVTATVLALIANRNDAPDSHRNEAITSPFWSQLKISSNGNIGYIFLGTDRWHLGFLPNYYTSQLAAQEEQPWCFVSLQPQDGDESFVQWSQLWDLSRQYCTGSWRITAGDVKLMSASCTGSDRPKDIDPSLQPNLILSRLGPALSIVDTFSSALLDFMAPFQDARNSSVWARPTMAMSVASAYWSRIAVILGPGSPHWLGNNSFAGALARQNLTSHTTTDGLLYNGAATITSTRPALQQSGLLYAALLLQPVTILIVTSVNMFWRRVPIGRGFGLTSILAGVEQSSLPLLSGAGYSGELKKAVHLGITSQMSQEGKAGVGYQLSTSRPSKPKSMLHSSRYS